MLNSVCATRIRCSARPISDMNCPMSPSVLALDRRSSSTRDCSERPFSSNFAAVSVSLVRNVSCASAEDFCAFRPTISCSIALIWRSLMSRCPAESACREANSERCAAMLLATSRLPDMASSCSGKETSVSPLRSASSRALVASSVACLMVRRCSSARELVSSSCSIAWPSTTLSPSLTRILAMMPPSRCCTSLFWPVATKLPRATTAPESGAVVAQRPRPKTNTTIVNTPTRAGRRMLCFRSRVQPFSCASRSDAGAPTAPPAKAGTALIG